MAGSDTGTPVALVTGASSGIGRATAQLLSKSGYRVFGTSRAPAADRDGAVEMLPLEVTSDESVAACVAAVSARTGGRADVLVSNVGTGILGAAEESTADEVRALFDVNVFGGVRVTNAVLPLMRSRGTGRIVVMSSAGGVSSVPFAGYYCATKHALEAYAEALRIELRPLGIAVTVIAPGPVSTPAGDRAWRPKVAIPAYAPDRDRLTALFVDGIRKGISPDRVAATVLTAVRAAWPKPRYRVGASSWATSFFRSVLPASVFEAGVRMLVRR